MSVFNAVTQDPLITTNFYLEITGQIIANLTSVDGLNLEIEKTDINQRLDKGVLVQHVAPTRPKFTGELTVKRLAPLDSTSDPLWKWFLDIRNNGIPAATRDTQRKDGSIVVMNTGGLGALVEVSRWSFTAAWPSKIQVDSFEVTKNDPVSETITFQYETLNRTK